MVGAVSSVYLNHGMKVHAFKSTGVFLVEKRPENGEHDWLRVFLQPKKDRRARGPASRLHYDFDVVEI
eukprot:3444548-Amphidinium_carterae.3